MRSLFIQMIFTFLFPLFLTSVAFAVSGSTHVLEEDNFDIIVSYNLNSNRGELNRFSKEGILLNSTQYPGEISYLGLIENEKKVVHSVGISSLSVSILNPDLSLTFDHLSAIGRMWGRGLQRADSGFYFYDLHVRWARFSFFPDELSFSWVYRNVDKQILQSDPLFSSRSLGGSQFSDGRLLFLTERHYRQPQPSRIPEIIILSKKGEILERHKITGTAPFLAYTGTHARVYIEDDQVILAGFIQNTGNAIVRVGQDGHINRVLTFPSHFQFNPYRGFYQVTDAYIGFDTQNRFMAIDYKGNVVFNGALDLPQNCITENILESRIGNETFYTFFGVKRGDPAKLCLSRVRSNGDVVWTL